MTESPSSLIVAANMMVMATAADPAGADADRPVPSITVRVAISIVVRVCKFHATLFVRVLVRVTYGQPWVN